MSLEFISGQDVCAHTACDRIAGNGLKLKAGKSTRSGAERERERELPSFGIGESLGLNFTKKKCQARQKLTRKSKLSTGGSSQRRGHRKTGT